MTKMPRLMLSLPPDIAQTIERMREQPEFQKMPKSKIVCWLIRQGMSARCANSGTDEGKEADV